MRILVTGGAGFVGSHVVDALLERGHDIYICDDLSSGKLGNINSQAHFECCDISDPVRFLSLCGQVHFETVCHQAAQPSLLRSVEEPDFDARVNILGTINVILAARRIGARVVMASTSAVYDDTLLNSRHEGDLLHPTRPYGIAKMAAEFYLRESGLSYAVLRYGNVYGPRQVKVGENQIVPHALSHIFKNDPFIINGDGEQTRDFVYVGDIARANVAALESAESGVFNVGTGRAASVNEVLDYLKALTHFAGDFKHGPPKPNEPRHVTLNSNRAQRVLGWRAETLLEAGLAKTVEWYRQAVTI